MKRADDGLATVASLGFASHRAELLRLKGEARRGQGAHFEARELFAHAFEVADGQGAWMYALRAATSASRLDAQQGVRGHARRLVELVYERFAEGFALPDLRAAHAEITRRSPDAS